MPKIKVWKNTKNFTPSQIELIENLEREYENEIDDLKRSFKRESENDISEEIREKISKEYAEDLLEEFQQIERFEGKITLKDVIDVLQIGDA